MAKANGVVAKFTFNTVELSTFLTSVSEDLSRDVADATAMGATWKENTTGTAGGTFSLAGWWEPTDVTGPDATIFAAFEDGLAKAFVFGPHGSATLAKKYTGNAKVTAYAVSAAVDETVAWTATITTTGAVARGAY